MLQRAPGFLRKTLLYRILNVRDVVSDFASRKERVFEHCFISASVNDLNERGCMNEVLEIADVCAV